MNPQNTYENTNSLRNFLIRYIRTILQRYGQLLAALALTLIIAISCDGGLRPPKFRPLQNISGTVRYVGGKTGWPRRDSVWTVRVVDFKQFPHKTLLAICYLGRAFFPVPALQLRRHFLQRGLIRHDTHSSL